VCVCGWVCGCECVSVCGCVGVCVFVCVCGGVSVCVSYNKKKSVLKKSGMDVMNVVRENIYVYIPGMFLAILHFPWAFAFTYS